MRFPSVAWFKAVKARADANPERFRRLGFCDATVGIEVGEGADVKSFVLTFQDYGCSKVERAGAGAPADLDFALAGDCAVWREMIENIREHGRADLQHTLNYLQLPGTLRLEAKDQARADLFYRFSQTFQAFFDEAAQVPTEFEQVAPAAR